MNATIVLSIPKSETCAASVRTLNPTDSALGVADIISIKSFREKINKSNNKIRKKCSFTHFVRDLSDPNTLPDLTKLNRIAYDLKKAKDVKLGKGQISCIFAQDVLEIIKMYWSLL